MASPFKQSILISSHNQIQFYTTMDIHNLKNKTDAYMTAQQLFFEQRVILNRKFRFSGQSKQLHF